MICKECKAAGQKSSVYEPAGWFSTAMGYERYYDEDGKYHVHDPNHSTGTYTCSKGHKWHVTRQKQCPSCEYGHQRDAANGSEGKP